MNFTSIEIKDLYKKQKIPSLKYCIPNLDDKLRFPIYEHDLDSENKFFDLRTFPYLFPDGTDGYFQTYQKHVTFHKYCKYRILCKDPRWRNDAAYLFWSMILADHKTLCSNISILSRQRIQNSICVADLLGDWNSLLKKNSLTGLKSLRGTNMYFKGVLKDLLSIVTTYGPPQFFITLSAADTKWLDLFRFINPSLSDKELQDLSPNERFQMLNDNPVLTALHFDHKTNVLINLLLHNKNGPFGFVERHWFRVEFQNRGSPHLHGFLWLSKKIDFKVSNDQTIIAYLDEYISSDIYSENENLNELVKTYQTHKHTSTCFKKLRRCRFKFPRKPSTETVILRKANGSLIDGKFYQLKRHFDSRHINDYNPKLLQYWQANMDIQLLNSVSHVVRYVSYYISKNEPKNFKINLNEILSNYPESINIAKLVRIVGNTYLNSRVVSSQEAAYRVLAQRYIRSTTDVMYLPVTPKSERVKILKQPKFLNDPESTDIFMNNILDYYSQRPNNHLFNHMCLVCFARNFRYLSAEESYDYTMPDVKKSLRIRGNTIAIRFPFHKGLHVEKYYNIICLLFIPWRNEDDFLQISNSWKEIYDSLQKYICIEQKEIYDQFDLISNRCEYPVDHNMNLTDDIDDMDYEITDNFQHRLIENRVYNKYPLSDMEYFKMKELFDPQQSYIHDYILKTISQNTQIKIAILGSAGTGKSFLIKLLKESLERYYNQIENAVLILGPTGISSFNINGNTYHSMLLLSDHDSNDNQNLRFLRDIYKNLKCIIIDEISMIGYRNFHSINRQLNLIKKVEPSDIFGNVHMILFGDFYQLPPVRDSFIFEETHIYNIWNSFSKYILSINHRQSDSNFYEFLNRLKRVTLIDSDFKLIKSRIIDSDAQIPLDCLMLFALKKQVLQYNNEILHKLEHSIYCIEAVDNISVTLKNIEITDENLDAFYFPKKVSFSDNSIIMITKNIYTPKFVYNGMIGVIKKINTINDEIISVDVQFKDYEKLINIQKIIKTVLQEE